ncbi:hypothetical protein L211DRAFT_853655 [Terfezia boudieri ATCC MYA-4762]|uniref:SAP domain-containing protein n=1 Tax=Terfezia boudieri ATCC MYA-4762 TaxID=1051890 RepID=A0A3N4LBV6_9PEZI|nr:hypothetical protein L211DRAFT_853655 [Terfezia boudieri ATCC MYA-4762]
MATNCKGIKTSRDLLFIPTLTIDTEFLHRYADKVSAFICAFIRDFREPIPPPHNPEPPVLSNTNGTVPTLLRPNPNDAQASAPNAYATYMSYKKTELSNMLKERRLPYSGPNKETLIQRLLLNDHLHTNTTT